MIWVWSLGHAPAQHLDDHETGHDSGNQDSGNWATQETGQLRDLRDSGNCLHALRETAIQERKTSTQHTVQQTGGLGGGGGGVGGRIAPAFSFPLSPWFSVSRISGFTSFPNLRFPNSRFPVS